MNYNIFLLIGFCFLMACNGNEQTTNVEIPTEDQNTEKVEKPKTQPKKLTAAISHQELDLSDCAGIYIKGGHDDSWLLSVKEYDGRVEGLLTHFEGMLPPLDMLQGDALVEGATSQTITLDINTKEQTFTSEIGAGKIDGGTVVFNGGTEQIETNLTLTKDDTYAPLMEDK